MNELQTAPPSTALGETIPVFARWFGSWRVSIARRALGVGELTRRYDRTASRWDGALRSMGFPGAYESMLCRVLQQEGSDAWDETGRVLDCGAGTGALALALARVVPAPFQLDAIDLSMPMLECARTGLREAGLDATLRQGDVCALPYPDDTFDLVMSAHLLEHLPDPRVALAEMVRVLKPGGRLVVSVTRRSWLGMWIHLRWRTHRLSEDRIERWLFESGLREVTRHAFDAAPICRRLSWTCSGRKRLCAPL